MNAPMPEPRLSRRELDRLAVLRVFALAYPDRQKVEVFRSDVLDLLAVVDRMMTQPRVGTFIVIHDPAVGCMSGSMTVHQNQSRQ